MVSDPSISGGIALMRCEPVVSGMAHSIFRNVNSWVISVAAIRGFVRNNVALATVSFPLFQRFFTNANGDCSRGGNTRVGHSSQQMDVRCTFRVLEVLKLTRVIDVIVYAICCIRMGVAYTTTVSGGESNFAISSYPTLITLAHTGGVERPTVIRIAPPFVITTCMI